MAQNKVESTPKVVDSKEERRLNKRDDESDEHSFCDESNKKEAITTEEALEARPDDPCHTNRFQRRRRLQRRLRSRSRKSKSRRRSRSKRRRH